MKRWKFIVLCILCSLAAMAAPLMFVIGILTLIKLSA